MGLWGRAALVIAASFHQMSLRSGCALPSLLVQSIYMPPPLLTPIPSYPLNGACLQTSVDSAVAINDLSVVVDLLNIVNQKA